MIPRFITALLDGEPPVVFGDGEQSRDFTYIDNVVDANLLAAEAEDVSGQAFNVACGERISLNRLLDELRGIIGTEVEASYLEARPGDVKHSLADISRARSSSDTSRSSPSAKGCAARSSTSERGRDRSDRSARHGEPIAPVPRGRRRMPSALAVLSEDGSRTPEAERRFFAKLRLPNGTWKTTYPNRLDDLNQRLLEFLPRGRRLDVMDVAVSSGVSTLEWSDQLASNGFHHRLVAGDLIIEGRLRSWGGRLAVLFDDSGEEPLLLEVGPVTLPVRSERWLIRMVRPILSPLLRAIPGGRGRPIPLVAAELRRRPEIEVVRDDVTVPGRFPSEFDVVRAANLVQPAYFDEPTMRRALANLREQAERRRPLGRRPDRRGWHQSRDDLPAQRGSLRCRGVAQRRVRS